MTVSPDSPPLRFDNLAEAVRALHELGLRLSTARRLILAALFSAEGPVPAAHLARTLSVNESSVYRNLEALESHGMVRHFHLGHGPGLYVLLGRDEVEYLYCHRCAQVTPVASDQLDTVREEIKRAVGYETRFTHFAIVGVCQRCAARRHQGSVNGSDSSRSVDQPHGRHHSAKDLGLISDDGGLKHDHPYIDDCGLDSRPPAHADRAPALP